MDASNHDPKQAPPVASYHNGASVLAGTGGEAGEASFRQVEAGLSSRKQVTQWAEEFRAGLDSKQLLVNDGACGINLHCLGSLFTAFRCGSTALPII